MRKLLALTLLGVSTTSAFADQLALDPGTGASLFTTNFNDGYNVGRGMWFQANSSFTVFGAGFFNQFTDSNSFTETLYSADNVGDALHGTALGSFTINPTPTVTDYVDGSFAAPVNIVAGNFYYLEVTSTSDFAGNYFYNWNGPSVNIGLVTVLDGGMGGDPGALGNTVAPVLRLNTSTVPEPASMAVLGLGAVAMIRRRRSTK